MSKHPRLTTGFALTLLAVAPSIGWAQLQRRIPVEYQSASLTQVVHDFAAFARRTITLAPDAGNLEVTASVQSLDWQLGLDHILAAQSSVARPDTSGVVRIEKERRITVEYQHAPLHQVIRDFATFSGRTIVPSPNASDPDVSAVVQNVDWQRALDQILDQSGLVARTDAAGVFRIEQRNRR